MNNKNGFDGENAFSSRLLNDKERVLMRLLFDRSEHPDKEKTIRDLTENMDIDTENMNYMLMLSILGFQTNWQGFPAAAIPRLKGIHRYCQAHNVMGMPWLLAKIHTLQEAGIPVMLLKGLAMRCCYSRNIPRIMYDYDIAVPRGRFGEAMNLLRTDDTVYKNTTDWSDTIVGKCSGDNVELDVHQWIFKE
ncbi:MAG: nucleotidyltransferase family protein, partial [Solobacterium sp.]|nr:nucleotidyltransferase family protein [Solobacterium sp.]